MLAAACWHPHPLRQRDLIFRHSVKGAEGSGLAIPHLAEIKAIHTGEWVSRNHIRRNRVDRKISEVLAQTEMWVVGHNIVRYAHRMDKFRSNVIETLGPPKIAFLTNEDAN